MNKPLLLLAALTFCCCIASLHGFGINTCHCRRTTLKPVPPQIVRKIEVTPVSGHCRRTEIILRKRKRCTKCVNGDEACWYSHWCDARCKCPQTSEQEITTKAGAKICVNPEAKWFPDLLNTLQKKQASSTLQPPTASTPDF